MPRPPRIEFPGAIYHLMSRGVAKINTFRDDKDRWFFLDLLGKIVDQGGLIVHAYCLMPNHFHLLAETPLGQLGRWIQKLLGHYAQRFNRRHDRVGHLWQGRYKAIVVEEGGYFLECSRYIHLNPYRSQLAPSLEEYFWSSYPNYTDGLCAANWIDTTKTMSHFSDVVEYRAFVESGKGEKPISPFERANGSLALGSEAFIDRIKSYLESRSHKSFLPTLRALNRSKTPPTVDEVRAAVQNTFGDWSDCQRGRILMFALRSYTWSKVDDIASIVGKAPTTVSHAVRAIQARCAEDPSLSKRVVEVGERLRHSLSNPQV